MVMLDKIYTRGGDAGKTSLVGGKRVPKHNLRVETYGTVDEANSFIGIVRLYIETKPDLQLGQIQNDLFDLGADLATPYEKGKDEGLRIKHEQVQRLENEIDDYNRTLKPLNSFVLPGGTEASAYLHAARSIIRRAERLATNLNEQEPINPSVVIYLNRLSDHLFVLARHLNENGNADLLWEPGANQGKGNEAKK